MIATGPATAYRQQARLAMIGQVRPGLFFTRFDYKPMQAGDIFSDAAVTVVDAEFGCLDRDIALLCKSRPRQSESCIPN